MAGNVLFLLTESLGNFLAYLSFPVKWELSWCPPYSGVLWPSHPQHLARGWLSMNISSMTIWIRLLISPVLAPGVRWRTNSLRGDREKTGLSWGPQWLKLQQFSIQYPKSSGNELTGYCQNETGSNIVPTVELTGPGHGLRLCFATGWGTPQTRNFLLINFSFLISQQEQQSLFPRAAVRSGWEHILCILPSSTLLSTLPEFLWLDQW